MQDLAILRIFERRIPVLPANQSARVETAKDIIDKSKEPPKS